MSRWENLTTLEKFLLLSGAFLFIIGSVDENVLSVVQGWFIIWLVTS